MERTVSKAKIFIYHPISLIRAIEFICIWGHNTDKLETTLYDTFNLKHKSSLKSIRIP